MTGDTTTMNRLTLRFADPGLEAAFAGEQARKSVSTIRIALVSASVLTLILGAISTALPQLVFRSLPLQSVSALIVGGCAVVYAATYHQQFLRRHQLMLAALSFLLSLGMIRVTSLSAPDVLETRGYFFMVLHLFTIYGLVRLRFPAAMATAWLSVLTYLAYFSASDMLVGIVLLRHSLALGVASLWGMLICHQMDLATRREFLATRDAEIERGRSDRLLLNILPASIAERLKTSDAAIADHSDGVTVLFADIVGFTPLSARKTPQELVDLLNRVFSDFDALAEEYGLEKIKTIGDAYMAAAGLPVSRADHAPAAARMALGMLKVIARVSEETGERLAVRIGLHSGPVVAGVIGRKKFIYDLWGDTVNTASRMESHGKPGAIQCTEATAALLDASFALVPRGDIEVEGKGMMRAFFVELPVREGSS